MEQAVGLPLRDAGLLHHGGQLLQIVRLTDDDLRFPGDTGLCQVALPIQEGQQLTEAGDGQFVVGEVVIPQLDSAPLQAGEAGLQRQNAMGLLARPLDAGMVEQGGNELLVAGPQCLAGGICFQVVVPIRQTEAGLLQVDPVAVRLLLVGHEPDTKGSSTPQLVNPGKVGGQRGAIMDGHDLVT